MGFTNPYPASRLTVDSTNSLANGLVGFWPLTDGGSSTTAKDITTNANDGTQSGGVSWASSEVGTVASFDGVDDQFDISHNSSYNAGTTGELTVSAWVKFDNFSSYRVIVSKDQGFTTREWVIYGNQTTGAVVAQLFNSSGTAFTAISSSNTAGVWYFVSMVWDGTDLKLYLDGSIAATTSAAITPKTTTEDVEIGYNGRFRHDGNVQNVRIYNRALSATEVATLYHRPWEGTNYGTLWPYSPPAPADATLSTDTAATSLMSGCVGWWPLTDGSGTTATDLVGSSNGTESGGVSWASSEIGTVASFDGVDDYFELGTASTLFAGPTITATLTCWVKPSTTSQIPIGNQYTSGERLYITTENSIWNIGFGSYGWGTGTGTGYSVATDEWTFLAIVINSGSPTLYVNAQQSITNPTDTSVSLGGPFTIGAFLNAGSIFSGVTDPSETQNVRIWDRVLTNDEITLLYERPFEGIEYGDAFHYDPPAPANLTPLTSDSINNSQIGWWPCTDGSGSSLVDISSGSNDGTASGSATFATTSLGVAAEYDGSASFHWLADSFSYTTDLTVSCWMRSDGTGVEQPAFCKGRSNACTWFLGTNSSDQIRFATKKGGSLHRIDHDVASIADWHHLVLVQQATSPAIQAYVDGVSVYSGGNTGSLDSNSRIPIIGAGTTSTTTPPSGVEDFQGNVANVRIWSRALTADEVWSIYANPFLGSAYEATAAEVLYNYIFRSKRFRRLS